MEIRLQKYLADAGIASRRKAEELITNGEITVNGQIIKQLGTKIDGEKDEVFYHGKIVKIKKGHIYIMLHKPQGYVTTVKDQFDRPTVLDLVKNVKQRIFPIGRLDYDTSGLLLLTDDGDLTYRLTHPKHDVEKIYEAKLFGIPDINDIHQFERGILLDGAKTKPASIEILKQEGKYCIAKITITEGKNRQVRKMCESIKHPVAMLKRTGIGTLNLGSLQKGSYRQLTEKEINYLKNM